MMYVPDRIEASSDHFLEYVEPQVGHRETECVELARATSSTSKRLAPKLGGKKKGLLTRRTYADHGGTACSCPTEQRR